MERVIAFYRLDGGELLWKQIVQRFGKHITKSGTVYFRPSDAQVEAEFAEFCSRHDIKLTRKTIHEHSGRGALSRPFFFLGVKDLGDYEQGFIEFACDGGGKAMCWRGSKQVRKVVVSKSTAKKVHTNGIAVKNYPISPRVYLVSRQLREALLQAGFTGLTFVPCLNSDEESAPEDLVFATRSSQLESTAACFQLVVETKTVGLPSIGKLIVASRCPKCGAASVLEGTKYFDFRKCDLAEADFQFFNDVVAENAGVVPMVGEVAIISGRALQFLRDNGIKGLKAHLTDPPIDCAAVNILDH